MSTHPPLPPFATLAGDTLIFNSRARVVPDPDAPSGQKPSIECRWMDTLASEPGRPDEPSAALGSLRGYLVGSGAGALTVRNVSALYHTASPGTPVFVHWEPLQPPPPRPATAGAVATAESPATSPAARLVLTSGALVLVSASAAADGSGDRKSVV